MIEVIEVKPADFRGEAEIQLHVLRSVQLKIKDHALWADSRLSVRCTSSRQTDLRPCYYMGVNIFTICV
jgi:hypothetical protein